MSIAQQDHPVSAEPAAPTRPHWTGADPASPWILEARDLVPELAADAARVDQTGEFVHGAFARLRERRFFSMLVPGELGGGGASHAEAAAVLAELAHGCPATSLTLSMHTHLVAAQVWRHHRGLPAPVLAKVVEGQLVLVSTGASDWIDSNGSATKVDGGFRISGRKAPSSGAPAGDILVTSSRWEGPDGPQVIHAALPFSAEGVSIEETWDTTGMRATGSHTVVLDDVFVPDAAVSLIRPAGVWHPVWSTVLGAAMPLIMATYVGVAESAAERALALAARRAERPDVASLAGRMVTRLTTAQDAVRAMLDASEDLHFDNDLEHASRTLARKTVAAEAAIETVQLALEVGGGAAFGTGSGIGRLLRDVHGALYHPLPAAQQERFTGRVALGLDPIG